MDLGLNLPQKEELVIEVPAPSIEDMAALSEYLSTEKDMSDLHIGIQNLVEMKDVLNKHGMHPIVHDLVGPQLDSYMPKGVTFSEATVEQATEGLLGAIKTGIKKIWEFIVSLFKKVVKVVKSIVKTIAYPLKRLVTIKASFGKVESTSFKVTIVKRNTSSEGIDVDVSTEAIPVVSSWNIVTHANFREHLSEFQDFMTYMNSVMHNPNTLDVKELTALAGKVGIEFREKSGMFVNETKTYGDNSRKDATRHKTLEDAGWTKEKAISACDDVTALLKLLSAGQGIADKIIENLDKTGMLAKDIQVSVAKDAMEVIKEKTDSYASMIPDFDDSRMTPPGAIRPEDQMISSNSQKWANTLATFILVANRSIKDTFVGILVNVLHLTQPEKWAEPVEGSRMFW